MKNRLLPVVIAATLGLSAWACGAREYYLVGLRHVYMFDVWPDTHKADRHAIEESFSASIASAQQTYDADMTSIREEEAQDGGNIHQIDRDAVQQNLEQDIAEAADARDDAFGQLYVQCDYMRATQPEFAVDQDGPYEVIGCDVGPEGEFLDLCFYKPYPGYLGPCPFDWVWRQPYPLMEFSMQVQMFHSSWMAAGSPVFAPMYVGGLKVAVMAPVRISVIKSRSSWAGGRPPMISDDDRKLLAQNRELQRKAGIRPPAAHPNAHRVRSVSPPGVSSKFAHPASSAKHSAPAASRFSRLPSHRGSAATGPAASGSKPPVKKIH